MSTTSTSLGCLRSATGIRLASASRLARSIASLKSRGTNWAIALPVLPWSMRTRAVLSDMGIPLRDGARGIGVVGLRCRGLRARRATKARPGAALPSSVRCPGFEPGRWRLSG
jgi:hypothetical protein